MKSASLSVVNGSGIRYGPALEMIESSIQMRSLSVPEKMLSWLLQLLKLLLSMSSIGKRISGFKVGSRKIERGIRLGQFLVIFGEVLFNRKSGEMKIENPICYLKDKSQMIKGLRDKSLKYSRNMSVFFAIMMVSGFLIARRIQRSVSRVYKRLK